MGDRRPRPGRAADPLEHGDGQRVPDRPRADRQGHGPHGELRQDARTSDLVFGIDALVAFLSETCTLEPGDLILTGTPSGVGAYSDPPSFLASGDVVRIEIERLGAIEHRVEGA